jgi:hypothetical protein
MRGADVGRIPRRLAALSATGAVALAAASGVAVVASATPTSSLPKLTIAMNGTSVTVGGALQSGGINIVSTTTKEPQGAPLLFRLNPGVTAAQVQAFRKAHPGAGPDSLAQFGAIVFNAEADRGISQVQTTLEAGNYAAVDQAAGSGITNPLTTFTIAPAASPAVLPAPQGTISTIDFAFRGAAVLHRGELVRFINRGFVVHMVVGGQVRSMAAAHKLIKLLRQNANVPNSLTIGQGFTFDGGLSPGAYQQMTITQHPGIWVLICFMNTQDGRSHSQLGMERIIRILN